MATVHPSEQHERPSLPPAKHSSRGTKRPSAWVEGRAAKAAYPPTWGGVYPLGLAPARPTCGQLIEPEPEPEPESDPDPDPIYLIDPVTGGPMRPGPEIEFNPEGAPVPTNEEFRLQVLRSYNILNTEPEPRYDRISALAAMIFHTPVALVSLVDENRQWFKSNIGLPGCTETKRTGSFCTYAILPAVDPCLVVCDALKDGRFCKNALVVGEPHIRFYAGAPLVTKGNFVLGSLCIIDFKPRKEFTAEEQELLMSLAHLVVQEMEKHTRYLELQRIQAERFEDDKRGLLRAIDAFSEGLVLCDMSQKGHPIVFVNEGWEKLTGYSIQEVLGLHCGSLLEGPLTDRDAKRTLAEACAKGESASVEILNYRKNGTPFWNWLRIRPAVLPTGTTFASGAGGNNRYYFGILSDCTLRKEKEQRLEAIRLQEYEAEASTRAKRSFVANISHEIRTPMNAILACSQLLTDMPTLTAEQRELSQMIQGSGQQLLSLINDILDFSKLDAGKLALKPAEFSLWGCLDFCVEMLALKCEHKGLHLSYNMDASVPDWIWADEVRLRQILTNLLSNAAKFTDEGGEVEVSVSAKRIFRSLSSRETAESPRSGGSFTPWNGGGFSSNVTGPVFLRERVSEAFPECSGESPGALPEYRITIAVRDTGIGIPASFQKRLFDAFSQCDNSRTRLYEGTGLGLAISRDLAERMGGSMWVESEEGVGSTFFVAITARGSMQPSTGQSLQQAGSSPSGQTQVPDQTQPPPVTITHDQSFQPPDESLQQPGSLMSVQTLVPDQTQLPPVTVTHDQSLQSPHQSLQQPGSSTSGQTLLPDQTHLPPVTLTRDQSCQSPTGCSDHQAATSSGDRIFSPPTASALQRPVTPITGRRALLVGARGSFHRMVGSMLRAWGVEIATASSDAELSALADDSDEAATGSDTGAGGCAGKATGSGPRVETGTGFDVFIVDCPVASRFSDERKAGAPGEEHRVGVRSHDQKGGAPGEESRAAVQLMRRACALARGVPTLLLASKRAKCALDLPAEVWDHAMCLSQPVRIKALYTTLVQTLAPSRPAPPLISPTTLSALGAPSPSDTCLQIAVAEDNPINQRVLHKMLKALKYTEIRTAANGVEVLKLVKEHTPDVILMDIHMPEMDGVTATTKIKAYLPEDQQPMIIALTADVGNDIEKECRDTGMVGYLSKPVQKAQLEKMLLKCVYYKKHAEQRRTLKWIDV